MTDNGVKSRVRGLLGTPLMNEHHVPVEPPPDMPTEHHALQVLTMAQRTAEEHLSDARREAERICSDAREQAASIVQEAQTHAEASRQEAERVRSEAQAAAAQVAKDTRAQTESAQRDAEGILAEAQLKADDIVNNARAEADELGQLAKQRYEDVVGSLAAKREGLQQQIEALEQFDREYRARLQAFMQNQMRSLWLDGPRIDPEDLGQPEALPTVVSVPAQRDGSEPTAERSAVDS